MIKRPLLPLLVLALASASVFSQTKANQSKVSQTKTTSAQTSKKTEFYPLDQLKPGMRATGYTVFTGSEPQPFEVEILGVMKGFANPQQSAILSRLVGSQVEHTGVFQGILPDRLPGMGPLGGIETVLSSLAAAESALILACDLPFLTSELLLRLRYESEHWPGEIIVPRDIDGRRQPLVAVYPVSCLSTIRGQLQEGHRRVDRLYEKFPTRSLAFAELQGLEGAERFFTNLNTPEDYGGVQGVGSEP